MFLYLVQHAEAKREEEDPQRPLSEKGREDVLRAATYLARLPLRLDRIFHSGKLRTRQTAHLIAETVDLLNGVMEAEGLAPLDDPAIWGEKLVGMTENTMLVGHLPHLERLASLLLCGDNGKKTVSFKNAGVVCLKRGEEGGWSVQWMVLPDMVL